MLKSAPKADEIEDTGDLTISPDLSPDHCSTNAVKIVPQAEKLTSSSLEKKVPDRGVSAASGPATLRKVGTERLTLTTCRDCAALAAQKR